MARITNALRHVHQYFRMSTTGLWYCSGIDGCTHYMPKNMPPPVGRMSICWGCEKEFMLTPVNMMEDKPMCDACMERQDAVEDWIEQKMRNISEEKKNPYAAFSSKTTLDKIRERINHRHEEKQEEKDEIEVIDTHSPECESYVGGECTCK